MRLFTAVSLVASVGGSLDSDDTHLLQSVAAAHKLEARLTSFDRISQLLHKSKQSHEICMQVLTGEEAPMEGTFIGSDNHKVGVSVGDVAPTPGSFCVPSASLALMERSFGLSSASDFEAAVASKKKIDGTMGGKRQKKTSTSKPAEYSPVAARCKPDGMGIGASGKSKTMAGCKAQCEAAPLCAAFEFTYASGDCKLVAGVDKELALQDAGGACTDDSLSCCFGKPLAAPQGYSHVAARCKPDGKAIGTEQSGKTFAECTAICDSTSLCAGFEFEFATGECEMVSGVDKELALQDEDGPCNAESCCYGRPLAAPAGFSHVAARCKPDGKSIGTEQSGKTLAECTAICDATALCAAFEFEFATGECEMVSGVDKELALQDEDGPCSGESCCYGRALAAPEGYSHVAARCKPDGKSIGTEQSGKTLAECRAICDATALCAAFEFEFATGECEMVSGVDKELALQDEDGPCNGESCCYGRPLAAPEGYSHVAARCKPDGKAIGTEQSGKTFAECTAICDSTSLCAGFEFEFATGECEMVSGVDKELALQDEDGPCNGESCCYGRPLVASGFSQVAARCKPDGKSIGTEQSGKTLAECMSTCDATALCAAFEFEFATGECEMVSGVDKELALQDEDGPCNGESCCYGRPLAAPEGYSHVAARCKPDGKSIGTEQSGKTLAECTAICDSTSLCAGFEFEFATGECEMVSGVDKELALQDDDGPCSGESCCYGKPLPAPVGYMNVAARCKPDGMTIGTEVVGKTLSECKAICDGTSNCAAFEFEFATGECEMVSGVDKELALQDDDGPCSGESCCYGKPLAAPAGYMKVAARCKPDGKTIGTEVVGKTLSECKAICDGTSNCAAFEFEFATGECEMVSGVDKELALQDDDGPCSGESCCYGRPLAAPTGYTKVAARCKPDGKTIGTEQVGKTLSECKAICDGTSNCAAFEFEFATGECEMVSGVDKELALQDDDGPCSGESCCYGRPLAAPAGYMNVAARCKPDGKTIGTEVVGKTLSECKAICDTEADCAAFEFEFATGECEMVSAVDKDLSLADDDGPCNGESCCYMVGTSEPDDELTTTKAPLPSGPTTTWTMPQQPAPPAGPFGEPWDCSAGIVGKTCDYLAVDKWFRNDMAEDDLPAEQLVLDTFAGKPENGVAFGPCRDFRGTYHRVDGGYVAAGEREDGSLSPSGYATPDGCMVLRFNVVAFKWQFKYVCDGLDEENYVQMEGRVDSGGMGVREFPMSNWFSQAETCMVAVQGYGSGESCVKSGAGHKCGRMEQAWCRQDQDIDQPEVPEGSWCPGGTCQPVYGTMTCLPEVVVGCIGKESGDACGSGTCQNVDSYNSTSPRYGERGVVLVCV